MICHECGTPLAVNEGVRIGEGDQIRLCESARCRVRCQAVYGGETS